MKLLLVSATIVILLLFTVKIKTLNAEEESTQQCFAYPNPSHSDKVTIRIFLNQPAPTFNITIHNISGQVIHTASSVDTITGTKDGIPYYDYSWPGYKTSGVYFIVVKTDNTILKNKFAIVK